MSSSSATSSSSPVVEPWPISTRPVLTAAVLSAWIARYESTCAESGGPLEANGLAGRAAPRPAQARDADDERAAALHERPPREHGPGHQECDDEVGLLADERRVEEPLPGLERERLRFLPVNVVVVIVIGEFLICWRLKPAFFDPSAIENVYLPAFRFWTGLPESLSDTAPDAVTVPTSVPRNGTIAEPTTSVELALPVFPLEIGRRRLAGRRACRARVRGARPTARST